MNSDSIAPVVNKNIVHVKLRPKVDMLVNGQVPKTTVLSIDGGGMRGLVAAGVASKVEQIINDAIKKKLAEAAASDAAKSHLTSIYDLTWWQNGAGGEGSKDLDALLKAMDTADMYVYLADYFDVMAGTSTGSILSTFFATKGGQTKNILGDANKGASAFFKPDGSLDVAKRDAAMKAWLNDKRPAAEKAVQEEEEAKRNNPNSNDTKKKITAADILKKELTIAAKQAGYAQYATFKAKYEKYGTHDYKPTVPGSARAAQAMFVAMGTSIFKGTVLPLAFPNGFIQQLNGLLKGLISPVDPLKWIINSDVFAFISDKLADIVENFATSAKAAKMFAYPKDGIEALLQQAFGTETRLSAGAGDGGLHTCLVVPAFQATDNRAVFFFCSVHDRKYGFVVPNRSGRGHFVAPGTKLEPKTPADKVGKGAKVAKMANQVVSRSAIETVSKAAFTAGETTNKVTVTTTADNAVEAVAKELHAAAEKTIQELPKAAESGAGGSPVAVKATIEVSSRAMTAGQPATGGKGQVLFNKGAFSAVVNADPRLWQVVRASTAAPTFFEGTIVPEFDDDEYLVDGGVVANDPAQEALVFTLQKFAKRTPALLSIGCGTAVGPLDTGIAEGGPSWLMNMTNLLMGAADEQGTARFLQMFNSVVPGAALRVQASVLLPGASEADEQKLPLAPGSDGDFLKAAPEEWIPVLQRMDRPDDWATLLNIGAAVANDFEADITAWVKQNIFMEIAVPAA